MSYDDLGWAIINIILHLGKEGINNVKGTLR